MTNPLRSGPKRHPLKYQTRTTAADDLGQPVETWATASTHWAEVRGLSGRELLRARQMNALADKLVTTWHPGYVFSTLGRFVDGPVNVDGTPGTGAVTLNITASFDPHGDRREVLSYVTDQPDPAPQG